MTDDFLRSSRERKVEEKNLTSKQREKCLREQS